ncbi:hypothetical protein IMT09_12190 [Burkholderia cepacia]|uniref:hypothetical protein n=1 Tax=Burkholderia cepacia TaxID=292 RepID=UPI00075D3975|nr:hypothetical protein [Burkholderia cepacia]KVL17864.1 hypothetical protein WJ46_18925 [Burkholderia cepacia]KVQ24078.1 hypothetical protein WK02_29570 [Burkholderia cepacia]KVZ23974.1 hypothetical protein WL14_17255 [Burkholderia cepacia]MBE2968861.1 hypothetical protein [Burkholderia cepacia]
MKVLVVGLLSVATATFGATPGIDEAGVLRQVLSCPLADGSRIALEARSHGLDGDALFVRRGHKTGRAFLDMPETDFVGRIALSRCVGKTLVFVLNYGSPYLKGVAIRLNPVTHVEERIYFAEKALPRWLYSGRRAMWVIIPNEGGETDGKYLVYRYSGSKGRPSESTPADRLPVATRDLVRIE